MTKKHVSGSSLSQAFNNDTKIERLEVTLQELHHKIQQTRGTKMLEEKVYFSLHQLLVQG